MLTLFPKSNENAKDCPIFHKLIPVIAGFVDVLELRLNSLFMWIRVFLISSVFKTTTEKYYDKQLILRLRPNLGKDEVHNL